MRTSLEDLVNNNKVNIVSILGIMILYLLTDTSLFVNYLTLMIVLLVICFFTYLSNPSTPVNILITFVGIMLLLPIHNLYSDDDLPNYYWYEITKSTTYEYVTHNESYEGRIDSIFEKGTLIRTHRSGEFVTEIDEKRIKVDYCYNFGRKYKIIEKNEHDIYDIKKTTEIKYASFIGEFGLKLIIILLVFSMFFGDFNGENKKSKINSTFAMLINTILFLVLYIYQEHLSSIDIIFILLSFNLLFLFIFCRYNSRFAFFISLISIVEGIILSKTGYYSFIGLVIGNIAIKCLYPNKVIKDEKY